MSKVTRLALRHPAGTTPIFLGEGALEAVQEEVGQWIQGRTVFVVSTPRVLDLHGEPLLGLLQGEARRVVTLAVEEGEGAKTVSTAEGLWRKMLRSGGKRDSRLVAFGGGSVGDLGGFVAGCFLRGIESAQVPTTLLAQVDAAIGGKTAVDLPEAKNSVGLFHHPALVIGDSRFLTTLPREELRSGLAEAVKMGFLLDPDLFSRVERDLDRLLAGDPGALGPVMVQGAGAKIRLVEEDPDEKGNRRLLNFGHTLAHALEAALGYQGLRHGEAVAYGMLFALRLAEKRGFDPPAAGRLRTLLGRFGLPPLPPVDPGDLLAAMERDKKGRATGLVWVLPKELGAGYLAEDVTPEEVGRELEAFLPRPFEGA